MTTRDCAHCGTPITVTTRNPNRRYCSQRCRGADWDARNRRVRNDVANDVVNNVADGVPNGVALIKPFDNAAAAANGAVRCPHCQHELAVIAVVIPAAAAHVQTPEVITERYP
ncbi:MAG TPA: hypothetical protein VFQ42_13245 [Mycobacterium sp.]|nr:hypothetical protein [Mycobacterium sp.]